MQKYLVTRSDENAEYHIFLASGGKKDCSPGDHSLCGTASKEGMSPEDQLSVCQAKPGTLALLSRAEQPLCPQCVQLI